MTEFETTEVPREALIHMAHEIVMECDEHDVMVPEGVDRDQFYDQMNPDKVDTVEIVDEENILIRGSLFVRRIINRIPASGGGRLEPPTNPPEYEYEEIKMGYEIQFTMDGLGYATLYGEVL